MKTKKISVRVAVVLAAGLLTLASCRREKEVTPEPEEDTEQSSSTDFTVSETIANDIESMGSEASENMVLSNFRPEGSDGYSATDVVSAAPCATVTISGKIITVDFGTGCTGSDGRVRSGKLIYNYSASSPATAVYYRNPGFSMNVTSQNYVVDGYQINIVNKTITNTTPLTLPQGLNPGTNLTWSVSANISIVKPNNAGTVTWVCNRTKELLNTSDTNCYKGQSRYIRWNLARVKLNGTASGVNASGETYSSQATDLVRDFGGCVIGKRRPFISGTVSYTPGSRKTRLIDYGNGTCDLNATVTINGKTYAFTLQ